MKMTRRLRAVVLLGLVLVSSAPIVGAQETARSASAKKTSTRSTVSDAREPFDLSLDVLPPNFAGHPFMKVYEASVLSKPRGEFETTAKYEKRSMRDFGLVAFVARDTEFNGIEMRYDADQETVQVSVRPFGAEVGLAGRENIPGYLIDRRVTRTSKVPATNAFGATALIEKRAQEFRILTLPAPGPLSGGIAFTFALPLAEAPRIKPHLRVLFAGTVTATQAPPIAVEGVRWNGYGVIEATLDDPLEVSTAYFNLSFEITDVWVFDERTGKVYSKRSQQPDRDEMKLSIYDGENGYARATLAGNDRLSLTRSGDGRCHIAVSAAFEIVQFENGEFSSGNVVGVRDASVRITRGDGAVVFDEPADTSRSTVLKRLIARDSVLRAAQSMWSAAPHGVVEVIGGDSRFEGKASLAGFRELWRWGVERCGLPRVDASD